MTAKAENSELLERLTKNLLEKIMEELKIDGDFGLVITVPKLAKLLHINVTAAYQLTRKQDFPSLKVGKRILVPVIPLFAWIEHESMKTVDEFSIHETAHLMKFRPRR